MLTANQKVHTNAQGNAINTCGPYLLISALAIALQRLPSDLSLYILVGLVIVYGLPHGLLDPWIFDRGIHKQKALFVRFSSLYLLLCLLTFGLWLALPTLSLCLFLALSSWHFGEDVETNKSPYGHYLCALYGASIIAFPFVWHTQESVAILAQLGVSASETSAFIIATGLVSLAAFTNLFTVFTRPFRLEWLFLFTLSYACHPFAYFALYFCCLHSHRHIRHYAKYVAAARSDVKEPLGRLFVLTLLLLCAILFITYEQALTISSQLTASIFYLLAALTLPHMLIVYLYGDDKSTVE